MTEWSGIVGLTILYFVAGVVFVRLGLSDEPDAEDVWLSPLWALIWPVMALFTGGLWVWLKVGHWLTQKPRSPLE